MSNDPQALIDQIKSEWDFICKPLWEANRQYVIDLKNLVLKYASDPNTFEKDYEYTWQCMREAYSDFKAKELLEDVDVLEDMLRGRINTLEYSDD